MVSPAHPAGPSKVVSTQQPVKLTSSKPVPVAPRVDIESLYCTLKASLGDSWGDYKEAVRLFILGQGVYCITERRTSTNSEDTGLLNQAEFARRIEPLISIDPARERLHNQLINGVYANAYRDPPEQPVASWVSANEKPTGPLKLAASDAAEQRLKTEVMLLPARDRHRIKNAQIVGLHSTFPLRYFIESDMVLISLCLEGVSRCDLWIYERSICRKANKRARRCTCFGRRL